MSDDRSEMTPEALDELASAYLDGETTAEETALVESDPRLQALVDELREVKALVTAPVELPDAETQDQMIAQALNHQAPVVSLEKARRRLRPIPRSAQAILAAAAVVAAIAIIGVTVFQQSNQDNDDMFAANDSAPAEEAATESTDFAQDAADSPADDSAPAEEMAEAPEAAPEMMMADEAEMPAADADDSADAAPETEMAPEEAMPTATEPLLTFDTQADLLTHIEQLIDQQADGMASTQADPGTTPELAACPLLPDSEAALLTRFPAVVEGTETEVTVYLTDEATRVTQTTPPPQCLPLSVEGEQP